MLKFNINNHIRFKLTDKGEKIFRNSHLHRSGYRLDYRPGDDGIWVMQLWEFMQVFGKHFSNGESNITEDCLIFFDEKDLQKLIPLFTEPVHEHDCDQCHFLGGMMHDEVEGEIDYYVHVNGNHSSLIARFSSEPADYWSSPTHFINDTMCEIGYIHRGYDLFLKSKWNS